MPYCPNCGAEHAAGTQFCTSCGTEIAAGKPGGAQQGPNHRSEEQGPNHQSGEQGPNHRPQERGGNEPPPAGGEQGNQPGGPRQTGGHSQSDGPVQSADHSQPQQSGTGPSSGGQRQPRAGGPTPNQQQAGGRGQPSQHHPGDTRQGPGDGGGITVSRRALLAGGGGIAALGVAGFYLLANGGLSGKPPLDEMQVRVVDVRTPNVGLTSATIPIIVAFSNPADRAIPDISGDLDIMLNDVRVGSEEITVNRLEPGEETNVDLEVVVEYSDVGEALIDALQSGSYDLTIRGTLHAGSASREIELSTQQ